MQNEVASIVEATSLCIAREGDQYEIAQPPEPAFTQLRWMR
jgi:hypothetical protein